MGENRLKIGLVLCLVLGCGEKCARSLRKGREGRGRTFLERGLEEIHNRYYSSAVCFKRVDGKNIPWSGIL